MKVIALVSGGKDSCYSMLLCARHGHEVVALANLLPSDTEVDELDSYMYQTVGHQLVAAYAACTGLPLYRRHIRGSSASQGLAYQATPGDEVEDLAVLLAYVKAAHPEVSGVASGAIASDYQRLRVESVCSRLGLVSLAYLWHQPQALLLRDMITSEIDAVLVKVAAIGLDPHKHLGRSIAQLERHLHTLRSRFGCNVCGEGGEYETLTLDCPAFQYGRIVLDEWQVVLHSPDTIAPVGVLHPLSFHVQPKLQGQEQQHCYGVDTGGNRQQTPQPLPPAAAVTLVPLDWTPQVTQAGVAAANASDTVWSLDVRVTTSSTHVHVMCAPCRSSSSDGHGHGGSGHGDGEHVALTAADTASALLAALAAVPGALQGGGALQWETACFVTLYLADMCHFGDVNAAYCQVLPSVNPPSRACVQVPLPSGCPLLLDVLFALQPQQQQQQHQLSRRVLHVQSISSWAPSCIGPYSQATCCGGLVHMAGQIPLDPPSMAVVETASLLPAVDMPSGAELLLQAGSCTAAAVAAQAWRAAVSCQAVAVGVRSCFARGCLAMTVYMTPDAEQAGGTAIVQAALDAAAARPALLADVAVPTEVIKAAVQEAAAAAFTQENRGCAQGGHSRRSSSSSSRSGDDGSNNSDASASASAGDQEGAEPDEYLSPPHVQQELRPVTVYVSVPALPRGVLLELQPLLRDMAAADCGRRSSNSSSSGGSGGDVTNTGAVVQQCTGGCSKPAECDGSFSAGGLLHVHVTNDPVSCWRRVLVHLPVATEGGLETLQQHQAAAVGKVLLQAANATQAELVSVRCWHVDGPGIGAAVQTLAHGLAAQTAVQLVPVLAVSTSIWKESAWAVCEALLR